MIKGLANAQEDRNEERGQDREYRKDGHQSDHPDGADFGGREETVAAQQPVDSAIGCRTRRALHRCKDAGEARFVDCRGASAAGPGLTLYPAFAGYPAHWFADAHIDESLGIFLG